MIWKPLPISPYSTIRICYIASNITGMQYQAEVPVLIVVN